MLLSPTFCPSKCAITPSESSKGLLGAETLILYAGRVCWGERFHASLLASVSASSIIGAKNNLRASGHARLSCRANDDARYVGPSRAR